MEMHLKEGATVSNFENRYRCKDGSFKWLSWTAQAVREEGMTTFLTSIDTYPAAPWTGVGRSTGSQQRCVAGATTQ